MTPFDTALAFVLLHEGGYSNDPHDPGGETNYGICKKDHPNVNIRDLTMQEAASIYRREYWNAVHGD